MRGSEEWRVTDESYVPLFLALSFTHVGTPSGITTSTSTYPPMSTSLQGRISVSRGVRPRARLTTDMLEPGSLGEYMREGGRKRGKEGGRKGGKEGGKELLMEDSIIH